MNKPVYEEESDRTLLDIVSESNSLDPMDLFIGREDLKQMESKIVEMLSDFENDVLAAYIDGKTYHEIAKELDKDIKSVDNALQRVKKKLEKYLSDKE